MILHCPCCHAQFSIETLTQDEAARELLRSRPAMLPSLMAYLTLFRTGKRALAFDRAVNLAREVMTLSDDSGRLESALAATVESMRAKRDGGQFSPLKNHRYLAKVLKDTPWAALASPVFGAEATKGAASSAPASKTARAIGKLENWKNG